jgi:hypothetical protein
MIGDVTLSNSYATGGDAATPGLFGLNEILYADVKGLPSRILLEYDITNQKVIAYNPTGGAATAPTTPADPLSASGATTASAVDATRPNITPGRGKEMASGGDLSAVTGRLILFGY